MLGRLKSQRLQLSSKSKKYISMTIIMLLRDEGKRGARGQRVKGKGWAEAGGARRSAVKQGQEAHQEAHFHRYCDEGALEITGRLLLEEEGEARRRWSRRMWPRTVSALLGQETRGTLGEEE